MSPQKIRYTPLVRIVDRYLYLKPWAKRYPLCGQNGGRIRPFFIIGSGRSGNTLLRAMLVAQGELAIPPESYVLGSLVREFNRFSFLPWPALARLVISRFESHPQFPTWDTDLIPVYQVAFDLPAEQRTLAHMIDLIYRHYAAGKFPRANRWGDKTPLNTLRLDELTLVFPSAQYIHIIRDGRDVVASYLAAGLYQTVDDAAQRWLKSIERAQLFGPRWGNGRYLEIKYEKLVREPEMVLTKVCDFLGIDYNQAMLSFWRQADRLGDTTALSHHKNVRRPLDPTLIGRWRQRLSPGDQKRTHELLGPMLSSLGYTA